jgi:hypothetical protein
MIGEYLFFSVLTALIVVVWIQLNKLDTNKKEVEEEEVNRWAIHTADFKFLIESYLNSLQYESMDAKEIRRELLEQIKKVCPDWDRDTIIIHQRD